MLFNTQLSNTDFHILDDHQLFAASFGLTLRKHISFDDLFISKNIREMEEAINRDRTSYIFLDFHIPGLNTIAEAERLLIKYDGLIKIIIVSSTTNAVVVHQFVQKKASGFISKNANIEEVLACISKVAMGKTYISPSLKEEVDNLKADKKILVLSSREKEVLLQIKDGKTIEETAEILNISRHTVVAHRRNMMSKLDVHSIRELLKIMEEWGYM